jgi:hypothetical protein
VGEEQQQGFVAARRDELAGGFPVARDVAQGACRLQHDLLVVVEQALGELPAQGGELAVLPVLGFLTIATTATTTAAGTTAV